MCQLRHSRLCLENRLENSEIRRLRNPNRVALDDIGQLVPPDIGDPLQKKEVSITVRAAIWTQEDANSIQAGTASLASFS